MELEISCFLYKSTLMKSFENVSYCGNQTTFFFSQFNNSITLVHTYEFISILIHVDFYFSQNPQQLILKTHVNLYSFLSNKLLIFYDLCHHMLFFKLLDVVLVILMPNDVYYFFETKFIIVIIPYYQFHLKLIYKRLIDLS